MGASRPAGSPGLISPAPCLPLSHDVTLNNANMPVCYNPPPPNPHPTGGRGRGRLGTVINESLQAFALLDMWTGSESKLTHIQKRSSVTVSPCVCETWNLSVVL